MSFLSRNIPIIRNAIRLKQCNTIINKTHSYQTRNLTIAKPLYSPEKFVNQCHVLNIYYYIFIYIYRYLFNNNNITTYA